MKSILISGGATGIGKGIAEHFAKLNYKVAILYYKSQAEALSLCKQYDNIFSFCADVRDYSQVEKAYKQAREVLGQIDIVVANSGIALFKQIQDCTDADFDDIFLTNTKGTFNLFKVATIDMLNQKKGKLVAVSSIFGERGASCESLYSASKGAINSLTKSLSAELGPSNICVNAIACGIIDTKMNDRLTAQEKQDFADCTALQKIGTPQDIAEAVEFLANCDYITGQIINVDGGLL